VVFHHLWLACVYEIGLAYLMQLIFRDIDFQRSPLGDGRGRALGMGGGWGKSRPASFPNRPERRVGVRDASEAPDGA
jgi:hypothetical protein